MSNTTGAVDGRVARSKRTHEAILCAVVQLLEEGRAAPTIEQIAAAAKVSQRTVFQHFSGRDTLFAEATRRLLAEVEMLVKEYRTEGPLDERLERFIDTRRRLLTAVAPALGAALLSCQDAMADWQQAIREIHGRQRDAVADVFAEELGRLDPDERARMHALICQVSSYAFWDMSRTELGMSDDEALTTMRYGLERLLAADRADSA